MKFPSGGIKERTRSDSHRLNRTLGWKLTSSKIRGFFFYLRKWVFMLEGHKGGTLTMHVIMFYKKEETNPPWRTGSGQASHWASHRPQWHPGSLHILLYLNTMFEGDKQSFLIFHLPTLLWTKNSWPHLICPEWHLFPQPHQNMPHYWCI